MKKILILLFFVSIEASAQSHWRGFWGPVPDVIETSVDNDKFVSGVFLFRPTVTVTAIKFTKDGTEAFNEVGAGLSYQHFIETTGGGVYNNYGASLLVLFNTGETNISLAGTINFLQYMNLGMGYDFGGKRIFFLTGITYSFN